MNVRRLLGTCLAVLWVWFSLSASAEAFCGFYVAKADTTLYNEASQVAIARDGNRTVLTMANDFKGDVKDFAMVVPVPVVLQKDQVHIGDPTILKRLDDFSAPRLVEYFDDNPCQTFRNGLESRDAAMPTAPQASPRTEKSLGVTVEAEFSVGEYDIVILSAKESNGLQTWLNRNGYKIPRGARPLLQPYIRQNMKFFVAKVNLAEFAKSGFQMLRPLQMAFESPKFMLPIRLGMINAKAEQDLMVYLLSPKGQAELVNYRTANIPTDVEIPEFVKNEFGDFYTTLFETAHAQEGKRIAFREYAWDMANCDPCSADPLTPEELRKAGVFWLTERPQGDFVMPPQSTGVFITRLHVRYSRDTFPEDLIFQETSNRQLFQGRYVMRHPYTGEVDCPEGRRYQKSLSTRFEQEAQTLAKLTGWNIQEIRRKMNLQTPKPGSWWNQLWNFLLLRGSRG
ncbi:MAG: DUF2330 domain-containing protein [Acaryochloris sp. RU_4_1]|nr:DUF2330 domain-containing protein [Acaryochloris sp. SU_5_25]NJM65887.1 DUF2330 domain-containing protein [Acaryochloris sp. RU_4_1]NJR56723.1 DUF2330 domain-containing protein [Acaryochloris sp. CRU_2_0]